MNKKIIDFYKTKQGYEFIDSKFNKSPNGLSMLTLEPKTIDVKNTYIINKNFFRSKEFVHNEKNDILTAGCSNTYGTGVPENNNWPSLLSKDKYSFVNLAEQGVGVEKIVFNVLRYISEYEKPEYIFCLFPDFFRLEFTQDIDFHVYTDRSGNQAGGDVNYAPVHLESYDQNFNIVKPEKFIKTPIGIEQSISPHYAINKSLKNLHILETFCKKANIKFYWSTWSEFNVELLDVLFNNKNFFLNKENYIIPSKNEILSNSPSKINYKVIDCVSEHDSLFKNEEVWKCGLDKYRHPGKLIIFTY